MRALLINPPLQAQKVYGAMHRFGGVSVPLGLASIAACSRAAHHDITIIDCAADGTTLQQLPEVIGSRSFDVVGISAVTANVRMAGEVAQAIRQVLPKTLLVVGGPHPSALPEETLCEFAAFDVAVVGEGEETWCELLEHAHDRDLESIRGIALRHRDGSIGLHPPRPAIADLDALPLPAYDLLPMDRYVLPLTKRRQSPTHMILASRGCPHRCAFCAKAVHGHKIRYRSPANVLQEVRLLVERYGTRGIVFQDSTLCQNRAWVVALCQALIESQLKIEWSCLSRVEQVDEELLHLMRRAGCWQISFGIESANQKTLDHLGKHATVEQARAAVRAAHAAGIEVRATYMIALPGESRDDCLRTLRFARELATLYATFHVTVPLPGSRLYDQARSLGQTEGFNWDDYSFFSPRVFYTDPTLEPSEMQRLCRRAHLRYYTSPRVMMRHVRALPSRLALLPQYVAAAAAVVRSAIDVR